MSAGQIYFIIALIAITNAVTWHIHTRFDQAKEGEALKHEVVATEKAQGRTNDLIAASMAKINQFASVGDSAREELNAQIITHPSNCIVPDAAFRLLQRTADAARSTAH